MQRMPEDKILHKVMPQYPPDAADHHVYGLVKVNVMIGKDGHVERIKLISGHPLLAPAALQAVRQWTFQPTQANGIPVHVITEVDLPFTLDARGLPVAPKSSTRPGSGN
jgi:protein TonB